jgi:hypothetical protein
MLWRSHRGTSVRKVSLGSRRVAEVLDDPYRVVVGSAEGQFGDTLWSKLASLASLGFVVLFRVAASMPLDLSWDT